MKIIPKSIFSKNFVAFIAVMASTSCRPSAVEENNLLNLSQTETHKLSIPYTGSNENVSFDITGKEGPAFSPTKVVITQRESAVYHYKNSSDSTVIEDTKFFPGHNKGENNTAPLYDAKLILADGGVCNSLGDGVYVSIEGAPISCAQPTTEPSASQPDPPESQGAAENPSSPEVPAPPQLPPASKAAACSADLEQAYLECRYYDGGAQGCTDKHGCKVYLSTSECVSKQIDLSIQYPDHFTNWDCNAAP